MYWIKINPTPKESDVKTFLLILAVFSILSSIMVADAQSSSPAMKVESISVRLGLVDPEDINSALGLGSDISFGNDFASSELSAFVDFWRKSESNGGADWSWLDIGIGGAGRYYISVSPDANLHIKPYAGAGLGLYIMHWSGNDKSDTDLDIGLKLLGGTRAVISGIEFIAEASYTLMADPKYFGFWVGASFNLSE